MESVFGGKGMTTGMNVIFMIATDTELRWLRKFSRFVERHGFMPCELPSRTKSAWLHGFKSKPWQWGSSGVSTKGFASST